MCAALEASKGRARVTLLEKEPKTGGNSAKATSGINGSGSRVQDGQGIIDEWKGLQDDTMKSAEGGHSKPECVAMLSSKSAEAIHWLMDELGVPLGQLSQLGGHHQKRTHRIPPKEDGSPVPVGFFIMKQAGAKVASRDNIEVKTSCSVTQLLPRENGGSVEVAGVEYKDAEGQVHELQADAVVLTTGGFSFDQSESSLMKEFRPDLVGWPTTNGAFADGAGIKLGRALGANLIDMDKVQLHPTAFIDPKAPGNHTKFLGPEALRGSGGILLDQKGQRFVDELGLRKDVSAKILEHCEPLRLPDGTELKPWAWCLLNEEAQEKFGRGHLNFYQNVVGLFRAAEDLKALAALIGCEEATLAETLRAYAVAVDAGKCPATGKTVFPSHLSDSDRNFLVAQITPCLHYCMGGMEINAAAEVRGKDGLKIRRLFAAGECTGGVHGENRLGGNSLLECVVFGRLAGRRASTVAQTDVQRLEPTEWVPVSLREVYRRGTSDSAERVLVFRFDLPGALQRVDGEAWHVELPVEVEGELLTGECMKESGPEAEGYVDLICNSQEFQHALGAVKSGSLCRIRCFRS